MADVSAYVRDRRFRAWLKRFFSLADPARRRRGELLYTEGRVLDLKEKAFGFTADVKGSELYQVSAFFNSPAGAELPDLDDVLFTCTCPDGAVPCKHIVAAVLKWAVHADRVKAVTERLAGLHAERAPQGIKKLEEILRATDPVRFGEESEVAWPFQPPLHKVMQDIQTIVKADIKKRRS
ncbi:SWIM zinc finger family protein [Caenibacillus caldisaponilyticus]|uniref:SWIM zinc finger family protein n=1 Tax=Caenibacillus caldisaponilyticus TaxID=1674942 RepID=UPI0009888445|nr:SWIM zinc finger family protein [Caenibacillus caldisaponilyticus]